MELAQILGWIATILFSIMIIPQIVKTLKQKDTSGVSLLLFIIYLIANMVALIYSLLIHQIPLITKYAIGIATSYTYLLFYGIYFKRKKFKV